VELELDELGLDGLAPDGELDMEPELDPGVLLEPEDDEEPDGEDGSVLEDEPLEDLSRDAPPELAPRSQPYRPVTATAMGRRTRADFCNNLIWRLLC
jgi:hypothetical protein